MRILLLGDYADDPRLGSTKVYVKLREEFVRAGHECHVLLAPEIGERPASARLRLLVAPTLAERAVRRAFRERGPFDVIDAASAEGAILGLRRRILGAYRKTALVSRSHGLEHLNYRRMLDDARDGVGEKPWHRRIWFPATRLSQVAIAARLADRMIVLNEGDRRFAVERGWQRARRIDLVPHGVSERFLASAPPPDAPRGRGLIFSSTWTSMKGVAYLVRAFELIAARPSPPRLTVLGPGAPESEVLAAFSPEARRLVTVVPRVSEEEVMRLYGEHDLLLLTSTYEGFGMVVPEALSQRLPVVATAVGCAPSLLGKGRGGILVPPRDPEAIAAAVRALEDDAPLRRRLGEQGHDEVAGLTWAETARRTLACYEAARERACYLRERATGKGQRP